MCRYCWNLIVILVVFFGIAGSAFAYPIDRIHRPAPKPKTLKEIVPNYRFFIAIGRCEQPAPADARRKNGLWPKRYKWGINWHHPGPSYPGGLGVWAPLWHEKGIAGTDMAPSPDRATPIEQMIHAQRIVRRYGIYAWGCTGRALAVATYRNP